MAIVGGFIVISLLVSTFFFIGVINLIVNQDGRKNNCEMTYMFEYPQFVRVHVPANSNFPQYGLYAYSEGVFTYQARDMKFKGNPVLFIPGNGGSYKQVRSLASIALRKALSARVGFHFDFFTVDLNEELSGLYGGVLELQSQFVNHSIYRILDLYKNRPNPPKSVIVIGHSMGGMVALKFLTNPQDASNVNLVITLCTPHLRPAILLDHNTKNFYSSVNDNWSPRQEFLSNKTVISIGGGPTDRLVNAAFTQANYVTLNALSTAIPTVWLNIDHVVIVWCKQLVKSITKALFSSIDIQTKQLTTNNTKLENIFSHYLINNNAIDIRNLDRFQAVSFANNGGEWIEGINRQQTIYLPKGTSNVQWHMIRLYKDDPNYKYLAVLAINLEVQDWIFHCSGTAIQNKARTCETLYSLSQITQIVPSQNFKRKMILIDLEELQKNNPSSIHIVIKILPTSELVTIHADIFNPSIRQLNVSTPAWYSLSKTSVLTSTPKNALYYNLVFNDLEQVHQSSVLMIEPKECQKNVHHAVATLKTQWGHHDTHHFITEQDNSRMILRLYSSKPVEEKNMTVFVQLTLDPSCKYSISIRSSFVDMFTQISRHYYPMLVANIAAILILALRYQLTLDGCCPLPSALSKATKPYYLITLSKFSGKALSWASLTLLTGIPASDLKVLADENKEFLLLPLTLYLTSAGIIYVLSLSLWASIIVSGSTINKLALGFLSRTLFGAVSWSDWTLSALQRIPFTVAITLIFMSVSTCGALALAIGAAFYFLKIVKMYEDVLEDVVYISIKVFAKNFRNYFKRKTGQSDEVTEEQTVATVIDETTEIVTKPTVKIVELETKKIDEIDEKLNEKEPEVTNEASEKVEKINEDKESETVQKEEVSSEISLIEKTEMENNDNINTNDEGTTENGSEESKKSDTISDKLKQLGGIHFHFTVFLIWCLVVGLNAPSIITWARNFKFSSSLQNDPTIISSTMLSTAAIFLWSIETPRNNLKYQKIVGYVLYVFAIACIVYGSLTLYRLPYILVMSLIVISIHQRFAPSMENETPPEEDPLNVQKELLKSKWE